MTVVILFCYVLLSRIVFLIETFLNILLHEMLFYTKSKLLLQSLLEIYMTTLIESFSHIRRIDLLVSDDEQCDVLDSEKNGQNDLVKNVAFIFQFNFFHSS